MPKPTLDEACRDVLTSGADAVCVAQPLRHGHWAFDFGGFHDCADFAVSGLARPRPKAILIAKIARQPLQLVHQVIRNRYRPENSSSPFEGTKYHPLSVGIEMHFCSRQRFTDTATTLGQ